MKDVSLPANIQPGDFMWEPPRCDIDEPQTFLPTHLLDYDAADIPHNARGPYASNSQEPDYGTGKTLLKIDSLKIA